MRLPLDLLTKGAVSPKKMTGDEIQTLVAYCRDLHREYTAATGRVYQLEWEKTRLEMENRFMIHLFDVKQGELDATQHTKQQHHLRIDCSPAYGGSCVARVDAPRDRA